VKTGWRRFVPSWKILLAAFGIGTLGTICMVGVAYSMVKVPTVNEDATVQGATVYWHDGSQMAKIGSSRTVEPLTKISDNMENAVLAAEDRKFYSESAISPTGIARAVVNNLSGGDTQGGSTITQQYVKNAYLNQQRTFTRKFKELFIAIKVGKQQDKKTILQNYLNTIYFGRDANGVEAAAQAYFNKHAADLTVPQSAVLAAKIKQPSWYDPSGYDATSAAERAREKADAVGRYNFVLDGMVKIGKLSAADFAKYKDHPPATIKPRTNSNSGQVGYLIARIKNSLHSMHYTDTDIANRGLKVYTTWDKSLQAKAKRTVEADLKAKHMPKNTRVGLVTMDPTTGEVLAAYGGKDYLDRQTDDAYFATAQVGSSFKPYVLAAALQKGIGLKSKFDASAPAWIDTKGDRVGPHEGDSFKYTNDEGNTNRIVDLVTATAESYNTVFVPLGFKAGSQNVYDLAVKAGLPGERMKPQVGQGGFFLGQTDMRPLDQAVGYSTIANDGEYITPHSIIKVVEPGKTRRPTIEHHTAFSKDVAHDVQYAMQHVVTQGTARLNAPLAGREAAGKTGTTNNNMAAWFSGFTPKQMVTTVGLWRYDDKPKKYRPLQHVGVYGKINGGDLPALIWHDYMTEALQGKAVKQFDPPANVGEPKIYATPKPSPTPTPSNTPPPICQPGQNPMFDHCQPDPNQNNQNRLCRRNPTLPQCTQQQSPNPGQTTNCPRPVFGQCPSSPPPIDNPKPKGADQAQQHAARPVDD
jgi:membrane peptidoglycan carboxypeptidase